MLRICLFGKPRFEFDSSPKPTAARPKVVPLLAYLLLHRQAVISRETVANALWTDSTEAEARANLRRHLHYLQQMLPDIAPESPWLLATATTIGWNPKAEYTFDVAEFEQHVEHKRFADAVRLYSGDLLEDVDEEFLPFERERLRSAYLGALKTLIAEQRGRRDFAGAIASAQALLARDTWREDVLRQLMTVRYESGDRAGAVADYERFAAGLQVELGVSPMPETASLYAAIVEDKALPGTIAAAASVTTEPRSAFERALLPFVGRDEELQLLRVRWGNATKSQGGLVLVGGEAGIGKTRLVNELAATCTSEGGQVFAGATTFPESAPYQPIVGMLRAASRLAPSLKIEPIWLAALSALLPELRTMIPSLPDLPQVDPPRERIRLFEACAAFVEAVGARRPACFILEDVHWAGSGTISMLEYLARRARKANVLLVATYREEEIERSHPLREMRRSLEVEGAAQHIALLRLSDEAVGRLISLSALSSTNESVATTHQLDALCEGNPFFLDEVIHDLMDGGTLPTEAGRWNPGGTQAGAPIGVMRLVEQRIARLSNRALTAAETAAVVGRGFGVELLRETTGWPEGEVLDALDELIDRRLISERGGSVRYDYAFNHHLVQAAVYARIAEPTRARRHRRIAQVLEDLYPSSLGELAGELALHWDRGRERDRAAAHYVRAAQQAAALYANDEALAMIARALELSRDIELRFDALLMKETIASLRGDRDVQSASLDELRALADEFDDEDRICEVLHRYAGFLNLTGQRDLERTTIAELKRRADALDSPHWKAAVLEAQARLLRATGDFDGARTSYDELVQLMQVAGDQRAHWTAHLARADTYIFQGRLHEARQMLDSLRSTLDPGTNRSALVRTLMAFARAALAQQDYAAMSEFAEAALEASTAIGDREGEALALHTMANGMVYVFRVAEARVTYAKAAAIYEQIGHRVGMSSVLVDLGLFHTEIGLLDRAMEYYTRAESVASAIGFQWVSCVVEVNRGYCLRLLGDFVGSRASALLALGRAQALGSVQLESAALGTLGGAERELGEYDAAIDHFERGVELRRPAGATPRLGDNLCGLALSYLKAEKLEAARVAVDEMLALYVDNPKLAPQPSEWLLAGAHMYRASGDEVEANKLMLQARSVMQARADAIDDDETRTAFLALPFNREVASGKLGGSRGRGGRP